MSKVKWFFCGPVLMRCSACRGPRYRNYGPAWAVSEWLTWIILSYTTFRWIFKLPFATQFMLGVFIYCVLIQIHKRLYAAWWLWYHPQRCKAGGHLQSEGAQ